MCVFVSSGFPGGASWKESTINAGDVCLIPGSIQHGTSESTREEGKDTVFLAEGTAMGKGPEVGTS